MPYNDALHYASDVYMMAVDQNNNSRFLKFGMPGEGEPVVLGDYVEGETVHGAHTRWGRAQVGAGCKTRKRHH